MSRLRPGRRRCSWSTCPRPSCRHMPDPHRHPQGRLRASEEQVSGVSRIAGRADRTRECSATPRAALLCVPRRGGGAGGSGSGSHVSHGARVLEGPRFQPQRRGADEPALAPRARLAQPPRGRHQRPRLTLLSSQHGGALRECVERLNYLDLSLRTFAGGAVNSGKGLFKPQQPGCVSGC